MDTTLLYRKAGLQDLHTLVDLRIDFLVEFLGEQPAKAVEDLKRSLHDYFQHALQHDSYITYLAIHGEVVAGIGGMVYREQPGNFKNPSGKMGYIMNMYTVPSFRRKGICSTLLEKLLDEGHKKGITAFELHATKEGEQVYPRHGFQLHNEPTYRKYSNQ